MLVTEVMVRCSRVITLHTKPGTYLHFLSDVILRKGSRQTIIKCNLERDEGREDYKRGGGDDKIVWGK